MITSKIKLIVIYILGFLFLFTNKSYTNDKIKIEGIILNSENGKPLPYANIKVLNTNWGTTTNREGRFELFLKKGSYSLKITYIGYRSQVLNVQNSIGNIVIKLKPVPIILEPVKIYAYKGDYTWEEQFILKTIDKKNEFLAKLSHYQAFAYSKTSISVVDTSEDLVAFIESVSEINFVSPNYYQEKVLDFKMPRILKNYPYQDMGIKLNVDLHHDEVKLQKFSIMSPLHDHALDYYSYHLRGKSLQGSDTLITINIKPKSNQKPLFQGELIFLKDSLSLVEAHLKGNQAVSDGFVGHLDFFQRYDLKNNCFNVPVFSKIRIRMNLPGLRTWIAQENTLINYLFNDQIHKTLMSMDKKIIFEPDIRYNIDSNREEMFHVPLTEKEKTAQEKIERIYTDSPFYLKAFLFLITDFPLLIFDRPATIAGLKINKFSNWYHFNKVSGHFLGLEYQLMNRTNLNIFGHVGYAFNQKLIEYYFRTRYNRLILEGKRQIVDFGKFPYNKNYHSLNTVFRHEDAFHYYCSHSAILSFTQDIGTKWNVSGNVNIERQMPLSNSTEFSILKRNNKYVPNYQIKNYWNNGVGFRIDYIENSDYRADKLVTYKGGSFLNASISFRYTDKSILKSTENRYILDVLIRQMQPIINPVNIDLLMSLHLQDKTNYIQNMNFLYQFQPLMVEENDLTFFTIVHYDYFVENYFRIKSDINLYNFPNGTSVGCLVSFLRPLSYKNGYKNIDAFQQLNKNFVEYGISVKGLSYLNLYVLMNNFDIKKPMFKLLFYY